MMTVFSRTAFVLLLVVGIAPPALSDEAPKHWKFEFPKTDFTKSSVDYSEIFSGGPPRDGIPPIDDPVFSDKASVEILDMAPVIGMTLNGESRAYPLSVLMWHEIVNDELGGVPISVTFCPLCNSTIVFDRRVEEGVLDFGTTGKLRNSDLVMYDRQTESFWQQAMGEGIVGHFTDRTLKILPSRLESWANFRDRTDANATVLIPNREHSRNYGANPYAGYDSSARPFLYGGELPKNVPALERVVTLTSREYGLSLSHLREKGTVERDGYVFSWSAGQNSALDSRVISDGKDVGNVIVTKGGEDVPYFVEFAFAFHAFSGGKPIIN